MASTFKHLRYLTTTAALRGAESVVGRSVYCSVIISNPSVSRIHASITHENGETYVRDLGSKNGTFVNGKQVGMQPTLLRVGDLLTIGDVKCVVESEDQQPRRSTTERPSFEADDIETTQRLQVK
ncbi:MAG: FHA domain-containing protein, partial [Myxococcota bacterium]